jgi:hypothetical protein
MQLDLPFEEVRASWALETLAYTAFGLLPSNGSMPIIILNLRSSGIDYRCWYSVSIGAMLSVSQ